MEIKSEGYVYALFDIPAGRGTIKFLEANGSKFFTLPAFETEKTDLDATQKTLIGRLTDFDWIAFPDVLAVDYFLETLLENGVDLFELDRTSVFANGEAVADRLRFSELHADLIAGSTESERIFRDLIDYLAGQEPAELKFLVPREESDKFGLIRKLREKDAQVEELSIYRIISAKRGEIARFKALLNGGAIDEFIISGPIDLLALKSYFSSSDVKLILGEVKISAASPSALTALAEAGIPAAIFRRRP